MQTELAIRGVGVRRKRDFADHTRAIGRQFERQVNVFNNVAEGFVIFQINGLWGGVLHGDLLFQMADVARTCAALCWNNRTASAVVKADRA